MYINMKLKKKIPLIDQHNINGMWGKNLVETLFPKL